MKILVIGFGSIAKKHMAAMDSIESNVVWYALRSSKAAVAIDGVKSIYDKSEIPSVDFILISNPTSLHLEAVKWAIKLNKPLMIEKPLFHELSEEGADLVREISKSTIKTYIACNMRFHPIIRYLKHSLDTLDIIELNIYCGSYLPDWRPNVDYRNVYSAKKELGGGVHLDLIHEIDYVNYLLGPPEKVSSYVKKKSNLEINSPDIAHYIMEHPNVSTFITLNYYRRNPKRTIEVVMSQDTWTADLLKGTITNGNDEVIFSNTLSVLTTYKSQMKHMVDVVKGNTKSLNTIEESYQTLKHCLN